MKRIAFVIALSALMVGCSDQNADTTSNAGVRGGYTMNEPAGASTKTNRPSGSTFNGQEGGSASSMSGEAPSGSRNPGPAAQPRHR
jgi:hypothetical protein